MYRTSGLGCDGLDLAGMATDEWTDAEHQAIAARQGGVTAAENLDEPAESIDRAAFWARVEAVAENNKWQALDEAKEDGHPWWRLGLAVGKSAEPLRQQFYRRFGDDKS